jgi:hypothetical protein
MVVQVILAFSTMLATAGVAPRMKPEPVKQCPVSEGRLELIQQAITSATSCDASMNIFQACSVVASGDVPLGGAVIKKCEGDFLSQLAAAQRPRYQQEIKRCWQKYQRQQGTMYRSFEAMCAAAVAQTYSRRSLQQRLRDEVDRGSKNEAH